MAIKLLIVSLVLCANFVVHSMDTSMNNSMARLLSLYDRIGYQTRKFLLKPAKPEDIKELISNVSRPFREDHLECLRLFNGTKLERGVSAADRCLIPGFVLIGTSEIQQHMETVDLLLEFSDLEGEAWMPIMTDFMGGYVLGHPDHGVIILTSSGIRESKLYKSLDKLLDDICEFGVTGFQTDGSELKMDYEKLSQRLMEQ